MARAKDKTPRLSLSSSSSTPSADDRPTRVLGMAPHLNVEDVVELGNAIERSLCEGEMHDSSKATIDVELHKALRVACAKARLQRVRAEHLLIDLKQVWMTIPSMLSTRTEERLNRIISICIDEYYAADDRDAT
jgi:hypothetical protein